MNNFIDTTMVAIPENERPDEKCIRYGAEFLSDAELLAVILRCGYRGENILELSRKLCDLNRTYPGLLGLYHTSYEELIKIKGIGKVKAVQLCCITELSRRMTRARKNTRVCFNNPASVADYYMEEMRHNENEELRSVMLDSKNRFIKDKVIYKGTVNSSPASPREIFREALKNDAVSIIVIHNHPSGDPTPSTEDLDVTAQLIRAGHDLGIKVLDHIIIGDNSYTSLIDRVSSRSN